MKRRDFFNISLPATGAILLAPGFISNTVFEEINRQFSGESDFEAYDLVINGAGLSGYFAALAAAESGKKVLIVDKRTSPGYEIAAKKKLWMKKEGTSGFDQELQQLFFPEGERSEIANPEVSGTFQSEMGDEMLLFAGSIRKGLLRNLLLRKVHVLLMTDVCGVFSDQKKLNGVLLAGKHGIHAVQCRNFIDASDNLMFSRTLNNMPSEIEKAGFVLELLGAQTSTAKTIAVPANIGLIGNQIRLHPGKRSESQLLLEFEFPVASQKLHEIEQQARMIAAQLGENFGRIDEGLKNANIHQFALETSLFPKKGSVPGLNRSGYYQLPTEITELDGTNVLALRSNAQALIGKLKYDNTRAALTSSTLKIAGAELDPGQWKLQPIEEPGLAVPLQSCSFDFNEFLVNKEDCQVLVAGGGTAGAMAGLGAAEKGANTIVVDYFNDLGGTKTMGGVMGYYHGITNHKYFKQQVDDAEGLAREKNMSKKIGRKLYHLQSLQKYDSRILGGAIICGSLVSDTTVKGVVICRNGKLEAIRAGITIDSTGDGDVAYFAGADFKFGDSRYGQTQNYSQWDISAGKELPSPTNRDYDIIDNTKIAELQRGLFLSHYEAHHYDFHPMLTVRESRRIEGLYELNLIDAVEHTHFEDVISQASSDFDPHNVGTTVYSRCGFLLPHSNDLKVEIPYRSIVPKTLDGLLISGRGFSQSHNALQFTRMTADLIVLGYFTGQIAADQAWNNQSPRDYDVSGLQKEWNELGYLSTERLTLPAGNKADRAEEVARRVANLALGKQEYLYECIKLPKEKALGPLINTYHKTDQAEGKLLLAKAIAWFGGSEGNELINAELKTLFEQEQSEGYPDGYVDNYDFIRGREKNVLEGLFWRINQNIGLLGLAGYEPSKKIVKHILEQTSSGGGMVERTNAYYNGRIDLKIVPFYNRILNLCFYVDRIPDPMFSAGFESLLKDENIGGFKTEDYHNVRWRVFSASLELAIAASMARCGSKKGYSMLVDYMDDIHYIFKRFAQSELKILTEKDFGFDSARWKAHLKRLSFPRSVSKLEGWNEV